MSKRTERTYRSSGRKGYKSKRGRASNAIAVVRAPPRTVPVAPGYTRTGGGFQFSAPGFSGKKYLDTTVGAATATAGAILNSGTFLVVPRGVSKNERIGNDIVVTNVNVHGRLYMSTAYDENLIAAGPPDAVLFSDSVRMIWYIDHQCNGATCAVTDILETANIDSFRNMNNLNRFKILSDKRVDLNSGAGGAYSDGTNITFMRGSVDRKVGHAFKLQLPIYYSNTTGAISEIRSNNIGCLIISERASSLYDLTVRVKYVDPS